VGELEASSKKTCSRFAYNFPALAHNHSNSLNKEAHSYPAGDAKAPEAPVTPLLPDICKELHWNQILEAKPIQYPNENRILICRDGVGVPPEFVLETRESTNASLTRAFRPTAGGFADN
jgi:hypothetical protein